MRLLITFLFVFSVGRTLGQVDSYESINKIAKNYLKTMYVLKDFSQAASSWDTSKLMETYYQNLSQSNKHDTLNSAFKTLCDKFQTRLERINGFVLSQIFETSETIPFENLRQFYVTYHYSEAGSSKTSLNSGILIMTSKDSGNSWKILDLRLLE